MQNHLCCVDRGCSTRPSKRVYREKGREHQYSREPWHMGQCTWISRELACSTCELFAMVPLGPCFKTLSNQRTAHRAPRLKPGCYIGASGEGSSSTLDVALTSGAWAETLGKRGSQLHHVDRGT